METIYKFTPNRQLIPTPRALFSVVIIGTLTSHKVSAASQLSCRQRIRHFSGDNEIADLDITATENGQKTVIIFIVSEIVPSCQGF